MLDGTEDLAFTEYMDPAQSAPRLDNYFLPGQQPKPPSRRLIHLPHFPLRIGKSFFLIFLPLLLSASIIFIYLTVYRHIPIPGLSREMRLVLVKAFAALPILPKTPEQILLVAVDRNIRLTKYTPDFSFSAAAHTSGTSVGSLDLHVRGPVDYTDLNNIAFDVVASFSANFVGTTYRGSAIMRKNDQTVFLRIDSLSDSIIDGVFSWISLLGAGSGSTQPDEDTRRELRENITNLLTHWVAYDVSGLTSDAKQQLNQITGKETYWDMVQKQASNFLLQGYILPEVQKLPDETIQDTPVYHLRLEPSRQLILTMMEKAVDAYASDSGRLLSSAASNTTGTFDGPASLKQFPVVQLTPRPSITPDKRNDREEMKKNLTLLAESLEDVRMDLYLGKVDGLLRKSTSQMSINVSKLVEQYSAYLGQRGTGTTPYGFPFYPNLQEFSSAKVSLANTFSVDSIGASFTVESPSDTLSPAQFLEKAAEAMKTQAQKQYEEQKKQWEDDFRRLNTLLLRYYSSHNSTYPLALAQAAAAYLPEGDPLLQRIPLYTYQRNTDGRKYLLYVDDTFPKRGYSSSDSTLYGITSESTYFARYLSTYDIDRLLATPTPTLIPTPRSSAASAPTSFVIRLLTKDKPAFYPHTIYFAVDIKGNYQTFVDSIEIQLSEFRGNDRVLISTQPNRRVTINSLGDKNFSGNVLIPKAGLYYLEVIGNDHKGIKVVNTTQMLQYTASTLSPTPYPIIL